MVSMADVVLMKKDMGKHIELGISDVSRNEDGTLTVRWGYQNNGTNLVRIHPDNNRLEVKKGTILLLRDLPSQLRCGSHMRDFEMVMIGDTEFTWNWFGNEFSLNSDECMKVVS